MNNDKPILNSLDKALISAINDSTPKSISDAINLIPGINDKQDDPIISNINTVYFDQSHCGLFSNSAFTPIVWSGFSYPTAEHLYQALKLVCEEDKEQVRNAPNAHMAHRIGTDRSLAIRPNWDSLKYDVMLEIIIQKVVQNKNVLDLLINTGNAEIVMSSERDLYWGTNRCGAGENNLGKIYMEIRNRELWKDFLKD